MREVRMKELKIYAHFYTIFDAGSPATFTSQPHEKKFNHILKMKELKICAVFIQILIQVVRLLRTSSTRKN